MLIERASIRQKLCKIFVIFNETIKRRGKEFMEWCKSEVQNVLKVTTTGGKSLTRNDVGVTLSIRRYSTNTSLQSLDTVTPLCMWNR